MSSDVSLCVSCQTSICLISFMVCGSVGVFWFFWPLFFVGDVGDRWMRKMRALGLDFLDQ